MSDRVYHCKEFTRSLDKPYCEKEEYKEKIYEYILNNSKLYGVRTPQVAVIKHFVYNDRNKMIRTINGLAEEGMIKKYKGEMTKEEIAIFKPSKVYKRLVILELL